MTTDRPGSAGDKAKISVRPFRSPTMWVIDTHGQETYARICGEAGVDPKALLDGAQWIELERAIDYLARIRALTANEAEFIDVCSHRIREGYGPMLHVLPIATPKLLFRAVARTVPLFSNVSRCEIARESRTEAVLRYQSTAPELETRELCLTRVAAMRDIPRLFGLPPAQINESECIARGDGACVYGCRFYTRNHWLPPAVGVFVGGVGVYLLAWAGVDPSLGWAGLPITLGLLGAIWELRRTSAANLAYGQDIQSALEQLAQDEGEARREILAFHQRQKEWAKLMEEQVADRTRELHDLVQRLETLGEARVSSVRGVSHDMRNPLQVLLSGTDLLRAQIADQELQQLLADQETALKQMERMLVELVESARSDRTLVPIRSARMDIEPWVETLRRRARALVFGREISVSVFRRREAPEHIETDRFIFERVADNLCSNAAKYTDRGSIVVELDGKPGFLTLKVSDTGVGIDQERIERIFEPFNAPRSGGKSLGVGLSVVVQLLAQIGGRLEVMSRVGRGTTFWAHFPITIPTQRDAGGSGPALRLAQVVTIRKAHSA